MEKCVDMTVKLAKKRRAKCFQLCPTGPHFGQRERQMRTSVIYLAGRPSRSLEEFVAETGHYFILHYRGRKAPVSIWCSMDVHRNKTDRFKWT